MGGMPAWLCTPYTSKGGSKFGVLCFGELNLRLFERDPEEDKQLTAVAPELSPKVASQKGVHGQNQIPGCPDDGPELQGVGGRLGSRSWETWSPDAERLTACPWPWSKQSPEASKLCMVLLPLHSVLVYIR